MEEDNHDAEFAAYVSGLRVEKIPDKNAPWRILNAQGHELSSWQEYVWGPLPPFLAPFAFETRKAATQCLDAFLAKSAPEQVEILVGDLKAYAARQAAKL